MIFSWIFAHHPYFVRENYNTHKARFSDTLNPSKFYTTQSVDDDFLGHLQLGTAWKPSRFVAELGHKLLNNKYI